MKSWQQTLVYILSFVMIASLALAGETGESKKPETPQKDPGKITWLTYPEGLDQCDTGDKHILIDFTASWCGWCKRMDKETFADSSVIALINEKFIPVKVWGDSKDMLDIDGYKISSKDFAGKEFGVRGYPAFWFVDCDGQRIGPLNGYQKVDNFLKILDYVADKQYAKDQAPKEESKN